MEEEQEEKGNLGMSLFKKIKYIGKGKAKVLASESVIYNSMNSVKMIVIIIPVIRKTVSIIIVIVIKNQKINVSNQA